METGEHYNIFGLFLISLFYLQFDCDVSLCDFFVVLIMFGVF